MSDVTPKPPVSDAAPKSPCVSICVLDDDDICVGCYRSATEITDWFMSSDSEKREILRRARERLQGSFKVRLS